MPTAKFLSHSASLLIMIIAAICAAMGDDKSQRPSAIEKGKLIEEEGRRLLWGGDDDRWHFDISTFDLDPANLHYGIGRERFPALIEPQFDAREIADSWLDDNERVLVAAIAGEVRVYPLSLLRRHEVVNDIVGGRPIFAAYCVLADLGAVYDRVLDGRTYTFALSGYTYYDPDIWDGLDAFVMWDRETESLWWPPIGKAVSGGMIGAPMKVLEHGLWSQTSWQEVKNRYPEALVLQRGQSLTPPEAWPRYDVNKFDNDRQPEKDVDAIAPRWGENETLGPR